MAASSKTLETPDYYSKRVLSMEEASWYLGLARSSLQKMTSDRAIPHYKPNARLVYFLRTDLDNWMLQNRVAPEQEVEQQALKHVTSKRR